MADEYIRKQEAIDIVAFECGKWTGLAKEISKQLKQLPAADVAPVVRCKDCRKCIYDSLFDQLWCNMTPVTRRVKPDDFCSYGERREE